MDDNAGVDGAADSRPAARCYTGLMPANLIITNGDSAVVVLKQSGIAGEMLPWRDVLHDGPVPGDMGLSDLSVKRARFLVDRGWANPETAGNSFTERNAILSSLAGTVESPCGSSTTCMTSCRFYRFWIGLPAGNSGTLNWGWFVRISTWE